MKEYTAKHFEGMEEKQGDMSPVPDGALYRAPMAAALLGNTDVTFKQSADAPAESGSKMMTGLSTIMKEDNSIYG